MQLHIERSLVITASVTSLYEIISDLSKWNEWSPWTHCEPTAQTKVTGTPRQAGQSLTWEGAVIGAGKMTLQSFVQNKSIQMNLEFLKPHRSQAVVTFLIQEISATESRVVWSMDTNLPFFFLFFKKMMMSYISSDFDRGLLMLKDLAELGIVHSKSVFSGEKSLSGFQLVGRKVSGPLSDLPQIMTSEYQALEEQRKQGTLTQPKGALALCHVFDRVKGVCEVTPAYFYSLDQEVKAPANFSVEKYPDHKGLLVDHRGAYRHLANPWAMAMMYLRSQKRKLSKTVPMYEIYVTMPDGRSEADLHTQIVLPLR